LGYDPDALAHRGGSRFLEVLVMRRFVPVALLLAAAAPARAANKDIERLQIQIASLQGQIADVMRAVEDGQKELKRMGELLAQQNASFNKASMEQKVQAEALQTAMREMQERLAEVTERVQAVRAAQAVLTDPSMPPGGPTAAPPPTLPGSPAPAQAPTAPAAPPPAPRELYSQAYADFARGNYDLAIMGFTEYLKAYPGTDFSDNAQYWIGECLYGKQKFQEAIEAWNALFRDYPASDKQPDARVKKGMALEKLGRRSQALVEYRYVIDRFPNSSAARIARERINP
jgi:tol-pal system protein YbgF